MWSQLPFLHDRSSNQWQTSFLFSNRKDNSKPIHQSTKPIYNTHTSLMWQPNSSHNSPESPSPTYEKTTNASSAWAPTKQPPPTPRLPNLQSNYHVTISSTRNASQPRSSPKRDAITPVPAAVSNSSTFPPESQLRTTNSWQNSKGMPFHVHFRLSGLSTRSLSLR